MSIRNKKINHLVISLVLFIYFFCNHSLAQEQNITIDTDFPGGNIIVDSKNISTVYYDIQNDTISLRPDLRDTEGDWFYWYFRVRGAADRTLHFQFPAQKIGAFGPAYSTDGGKSWQWLYDYPQDHYPNSFSYFFASDENEVMFSMGMPYQQSDFNAFITQYQNNPYLSISSLTTTAKGRNIEKLFIYNPEKNPKHKVVIVARHHSCEMMASYVLEGIISSILTDNNRNINWLRENVEFLIVPFMDKDGVEDGDQGKNRRPRDHDLDYSGESVYNSTAALRELIPSWGEGKLKVALDLHNPGLMGDWHEHIYLVGRPEKEIEKEQIKFANILSNYQRGELIFPQDRNVLYFGSSWNTHFDTLKGESFDGWMANIAGISLASVIEFPYANNNNQQVTPQNARLFGKDIAEALSLYLQEL